MKAIIFDMDGVIVNSGSLQREVFNEIGNELGFEISEEEWLEEYVGIGTKNVFNKLKEKHDLDIDVEKWVEKKTKRYIKRLEEDGIQVVIGLKTFLDELKKENIPHIIASNGHKEVISNLLNQLELQELNFFSTEDVENPKPAPDIYELAAKKLGKDPKDCVAFEDSVVGVKAAKTAGMKCVALLTSVGGTKEGKQKLADAKADAFIDDFKELTVEKLKEMIE